MAEINLETLKTKFETGDMPTGNDFVDLIDSLSDTAKVFKMDMADYGLTIPVVATVATSADVLAQTGRVVGDRIQTLDSDTIYKLQATIWEARDYYQNDYGIDFSVITNLATVAEKDAIDVYSVPNLSVYTVDEDNQMYVAMQDWGYMWQIEPKPSFTVATIGELPTINPERFNNGMTAIVGSDLYQSWDNGWRDVGTQFKYKFVQETDGLVYVDGALYNGDGVADTNNMGQVVGDWFWNKSDDSKSIWTINNEWRGQGTKDWSLPIYEIGSNDEDVLYVYETGNGTGDLLITFSDNYRSLANCPTGKQLHITIDTGPNNLYIDFTGTEYSGFNTHSFSSDERLPVAGCEGIRLKYGKSISFIQNRSVEDGDSDTQWLVTTSELFSRDSGECDGWGNAAELNIAQTAYQRYTLSEQEYNNLGQGGIQDEPGDGTAYVRQSNSWQPMPASGIADEPGDGTPYVRQWNTWQPMPASGIGEANVDGLPYLRKDGAWEAAPDFTALMAEFLLISKIVKRDPYAGIPNGAQQDFTCAQTPVVSTLEVFKDGLLLNMDEHYTVSGSTVHFVVAPAADAKITINYVAL